jgi:hypothetical protein
VQECHLYIDILPNFDGKKALSHSNWDWSCDEQSRSIETLKERFCIHKSSYLQHSPDYTRMKRANRRLIEASLSLNLTGEDWPLSIRELGVIEATLSLKWTDEEWPLVRFEVFTAVTMKNGVFWDVTSCGSCKNRHFGGT